MKRIKLIASIVNAVLCITLCISVAIAWYTNTTGVPDMSFQILQIDSLVASYQANDTYFNGAPDLLAEADQDKYYSSESNGMVAYSNQYHHEYFSFNYVDQRYALTSDSKANLLDSIKITDLAPTKVYTFKFEITNYSGTDNQLTFTFDANTYSAEYIALLNNFEVRLGIVEADNSFTFTEWTNMTTYNDATDSYSYDGFELDPSGTGMVVPSVSTVLTATGTKSSNGRLDLWLQIRTKDDCTDYFSEFIMPEFRMMLAIERTDN